MLRESDTEEPSKISSDQKFPKITNQRIPTFQVSNKENKTSIQDSQKAKISNSKKIVQPLKTITNYKQALS